MEAAIENAAQQTAQDLHMLLEQAGPSRPSSGPQSVPLGKENMATPAAGQGKKSTRGGANIAQPTASLAQGALE